MDTAAPPEPVNGNKECIIFLERWLEEVRRGEIGQIALAVVRAPNEIYGDSAGDIALQTEIHVALEALKRKIDEAVMLRVAPYDPSVTADYVCYNLSCGIVS